MKWDMISRTITTAVADVCAVLSAWPTFDSGLPGHRENGKLIPATPAGRGAERSGVEWGWGEDGGVSLA